MNDVIAAVARKMSFSTSGRRLAGWWLLLIAVTVTTAFLVAWVRYRHVAIGYALLSAEREQVVLTNQREALRAELVRLRSPERIARIAEKQLGLLKPTPEQMVTLP